MRWSFIYCHSILKCLFYIIMMILIFSLGILPQNSIVDGTEANSQIKFGRKGEFTRAPGQYDVSIPLNNESQVVIDGSITTSEYEGVYYESATEIYVHWEHDGNNLSVGLVAPGLGWVSLGIGSHKTGSNIIFGGNDGESSYCYDQTGKADYSHPNDTTEGGSYDIINFEAGENATHTVLEFIIPLNSTDSLDPIMRVNETIDMFFAYHATSDDTQQLGHIHSGYITVLIRSAVTTIQTSISITIPSSVM
ncbi:MAG: DOMON domain-containing protein, partial [Promethearchaeota archaeon]